MGLPALVLTALCGDHTEMQELEKAPDPSRELGQHRRCDHILDPVLSLPVPVAALPEYIIPVFFGHYRRLVIRPVPAESPEDRRHGAEWPGPAPALACSLPLLVLSCQALASCPGDFTDLVGNALPALPGQRSSGSHRPQFLGGPAYLQLR